MSSQLPFTYSAASPEPVTVLKITPNDNNNPERNAQVGMMSYPNFNGKEKTLQYVDFRLLAEEAERAGIDVRFIFLTRTARSILVSDTEHNNYGGS